tara:strand:+ start:1298 stop:2110 length:813 start_codon:yes stop_codon:yes gene_type:complete
MNKNLRPNKYFNSLIYQISICCFNYEKWFYPALLDIKSKYKNTKLGNFWNVITSIIIVSFISLIWSFVFKKDYFEFWIYYFCGFTVWTLLNNVVSQATSLYFINYRADILNYPSPIIVYNIRSIFFNLVIFLHFIPVYILIFYFSGNLNLQSIVFFIFGLGILSVNIFFCSIIISIVCTRYRDLPMLINTVMASMFLVTPILWKKEEIGRYAEFIYINPFAAVIDILRNPLLDENINFEPYYVSIILSILTFLLAYLIIKYKGKRIIYWI